MLVIAVTGLLVFFGVYAAIGLATQSEVQFLRGGKSASAIANPSPVVDVEYIGVSYFADRIYDHFLRIDSVVFGLGKRIALCCCCPDMSGHIVDLVGQQESSGGPHPRVYNLIEVRKRSSLLDIGDLKTRRDIFRWGFPYIFHGYSYKNWLIYFKIPFLDFSKTDPSSLVGFHPSPLKINDQSGCSGDEDRKRREDRHDPLGNCHAPYLFFQWRYLEFALGVITVLFGVFSWAGGRNSWVACWRACFYGGRSGGFYSWTRVDSHTLRIVHLRLHIAQGTARGTRMLSVRSSYYSASSGLRICARQFGLEHRDFDSVPSGHLSLSKTPRGGF